MARAGVGVVLVAAAMTATTCASHPDSIVFVTVVANQDVAAVVRLRAVVSNAGEGVTRTFPATTVDAAQPISFPTQFSLTAPRDRTGALDIALEGLDAAGVVIANGDGAVDLQVGDNVAITIDLRAGASACGNGQREAGEECDDGDRISGGGCDYLCRVRSGGGAGTGGAGAAGAGGGGGRGGMGASGGACSVELLANGNFDATSGWSADDPTNRPLIYDQTGLSAAQAPQAHSAPNMAWLGYDVHDATVTLSQAIAVPANAVTLTVSGFRQIRTDEDNASVYDTATLLIVNDAVRRDLRPAPWSNLDRSTSWLTFNFSTDAAPFAGGSATLVLHVEMDGGVNTSFFFDSLSLVADVCP